MKEQNRSYQDQIHVYGRIWVAIAIWMLLSVPVAICLHYGAWPEWKYVLKGLLGVAPIYWTVGIIEVFTYSPMLGTGGTYLGFVTGNLASLKVPAAINAMQGAGVEAGSDEGEVISTIAIATSSIVTTLILAVGVLLLTQLRPILESQLLQPCFTYITPALIGALAVVYISKAWKVAMAPTLFMIILFIAVPGLSGSVGIMVPVGVLIAVGASRLLYKKNLL